MKVVEKNEKKEKNQETFYQILFFYIFVFCSITVRQTDKIFS